jgi:outer membrane biosynthesis protein TonB
VIVISGALVLVALVLLIFGITTTDLDFVYASIVVSLVSFVFLLIGILQRRGDRGSEAPASAPAGDQKDEPDHAEQEQPDEGVTAVVPRKREPARPRGSARVEEPVEEPAAEELEVVDEELVGGTVLVVPGRPRYHVAGCRYLTGKSATEVEVVDARDEGFSPCGVCKPDDALAVQEAAEEEVVEEEVVELAEEPAEQETPAEREPEPEPVAAAAPARRSRSTASPKKAPTTRTPRTARTPRREPSAAAVAAATAPAPEAATDSVLEAVASEAPSASPAAAASDGGAATPAKASRRTGNVVVIPDRGKFHRAECRYVRNAHDTSTLSRTAAARQGYDACGVCKP